VTTLETRSAPLVRDVTGGAVAGVLRNGLRTWRGIPYAAPPVDELRLRAPRPVVPWTGTWDASFFGAVAYQDRDSQFGGKLRHPRSEDCLTLNITAPAGEAAAPRPVMVFIHGGAYTAGSSREIPRMGDTLVRDGDIVFVNLNYRLGALGYLDFSAYSSAERPFDGNLGLRDQVAALEWVRDNIAAFGGDPANVTVFGESAGGNAVTTLLATPAAKGLFARAIAESAAPEAIYPSALTRQWAANYLELLRTIMGDTETDAATLLSTATADSLVRAGSLLQRATPDATPGTIAFSPVIDGDFLPERPVDAIAAGRGHAVPLIIGTNAREGSLFRGRLDILANTKPRIRAVFAKTERQARARLFATYRALPPRQSAADFAGDYSFWYPSVRLAEGHAQFAPVHFYRFDIAPRMLQVTGFDATHGLELFAVFDLTDTAIARAAGVLGGRAAFKRTAQRMRQRWLDFARDGDPGADWPAYDDSERSTLIIDAEDRVEADPRGDRRSAWQAFVPHV
jgi:para-nitrobenzyl esterase